MTGPVVFRVDASTLIGTGHVMRCLTLAARLASSGAPVSFVCRPLAGDLRQAIEEAGFPVDSLGARPDADARAVHAEALDEGWHGDATESIAAIRARHGRATWVVVDHYGLDARWEGALREVADHVLAIDDLANRGHDCDVVLDQNLHHDLETRYDGLLPAHCRRLLGPRYALLRPEFERARRAARVRDGSIARVLVFFGGADAHNETAKTLDAIASLGRAAPAVDVIVGAASPHAEAIKRRGAALGATVHHHPRNVAELAARADLALGATGATSWERLCVGLPAIVVTLAANQESVARALAAEGLAVHLGKREAVSGDDIAAALRDLIDRPGVVRAMSAACAARVDGRGAERVARALDASPLALRRAEPSDSDAVYLWRNSEENRRHAHSSAEIAPATHAAWFARTLADASRVLLIAECGGEPVGVLRYDCAEQQSTVSIYLVPGKHARGYGPRLLLAGHAWLRSHRPEVRTIRAEVLSDNRHSAAAFLEAGYRAHGGVYTRDIR